MPPIDFDGVYLGVPLEEAATRVSDLLAVGRVVGEAVVSGVVGESDPILSVDADRIDLHIVSVPARISYTLAIGRVGRVFVAPIVVGYFGLSTPTDIDRVDLCIFSVEALVVRIGDLLASG